VRVVILRPPRLGVALAAVALTAACSGGPVAPTPTPTPSPTGWPEASPTRPVVDLAFTVAADLRSAVGVERVAFTPDDDVCELVFRAWPNKPATAWVGNSLVVTGAVVDGEPAEVQVASAGAPDGAPGTLVEVALPACVPAGETIEAGLTFEIAMAEGTDERIGRSSVADLAWFGTAFPLLAWENGRGWARDEAQPVTGEMATSEQFRLRSLDVTAPSQYAVLGVGQSEGVEVDAGSGLTRHRFSAPAVRDVTVTVGALDVVERQVGDVTVHVGAPGAEIRRDLEAWSDALAGVIDDLTERLGPFPYSDLWVSVIPDQTDGVEFPGAIQFGNVSPIRDRWLLVHEVAHMWFYGLVGNNQARDPWLDEAFATFVERVVEESEAVTEGPGEDVAPWVEGSVGQPMAYWATFERPGRAYVEGVYVAGGQALLDARAAAGAAAFDAALREYLDENAHEIAVPADVEEAFADVPAALEVLGNAGAFVSP